MTHVDDAAHDILVIQDLDSDAAARRLTPHTLPMPIFAYVAQSLRGGSALRRVRLIL